MFFDTLLLFSWPVVMTKAAVGACNVGDTVDIIANFVASLLVLFLFVAVIVAGNCSLLYYCFCCLWHLYK